MKENIMKWLLSALLTAMTGLTAGCGTEGDADASSIAPSSDAYSGTAYGRGVYEGEWTVNKQVVDTARIVVNTAMRVRLPQSYLLGLCFPDKSATVVESNTPTTIWVYSEGYSEQSQYMAFESTMEQYDGTQRLYNTCSFEALVGGEKYRISLLSKENANAVFQNVTGQWTLGIPINSFLVKNMATGETTEKRLSITVSLYYNTKKRVG